MAHKKAGGSTQNGRDSVAKRRGVKRFGGEVVNAGEILIRQKGYWYFPGKNTHVGKDWTIHANVDGIVRFAKKRRTKFDGSRDICTMTVASIADLKGHGLLTASHPIELTIVFFALIFLGPAKYSIDKS